MKNNFYFYTLVKCYRGSILFVVGIVLYHFLRILTPGYFHQLTIWMKGKQSNVVMFWDIGLNRQYIGLCGVWKTSCKEFLYWFALFWLLLKAHNFFLLCFLRNIVQKYECTLLFFKIVLRGTADICWLTL